MAIKVQDLVRRSKIQWAIDLYEDQREDYLMYDAYYDGEHKLNFSTKRWEAEFGKTFEEFADNWCQVVADAPAQRLEIIGWTSDDKELGKAAEEIWDESHVDQEQEDLHLQNFIKGDGYLCIWPSQIEDELVDVFFHDALEVCVHYDPQYRRRIDRAAKRWETEDGEIFLYMYYPDRVDSYTVPKDTAEAYLAGYIPPDDELLPSGWAKQGSIPNPYREVPVFHFKNRARGSTHGMSELKTVIPVQQGVNKVLMDMMLGSEFAGFPQKWIAGGGRPKEGWKAGPERVWSTTDSGAKFGQFDSMEFDGPRNFVELLVGHIAKTTQTPMHFLRVSGDMPSGEALKVAESGLIKKCQNRIKIWGHTWGHAMAFALKVKRGVEWAEANKDGLSTLKPIWKSPETRHDLEQAQTAQLKSILGVPLEQLYSEHFGYSEEQIEMFKIMNKVTAASALAQLVAQGGQIAPGAQGSLADILGVDPSTTLAGLDIPQILALLGKAKTAKTTAGEATVNPQANTSPPASPTRRSTGFRD